MEKELNEEYISLISQMRELNKKRVEIYGRFRKLKPDVNEEIKEMRTVSLYHDLYGNDIADQVKGTGQYNEIPTNKDRIRLDIRIDERKTFIEDLKLLLNKNVKSVCNNCTDINGNNIGNMYICETCKRTVN
jgi:hypothetical protein